MKIKILKLAGIGILLGISVCTLITNFTADPISVSPALVEKMGSMRTALLVQTLLSALYGAICMSSTVLYDVDRLPLAVTSLLHCLICIVSFVPMSNFLCWSGGTADTWIMVGIQFAAYFIIWLIMYAKYRIEIRKLNEINRHVHEQSRTEKKLKNFDY